jgi:DNA-binding CsgD family transcriptional regulator
LADCLAAGVLIADADTVGFRHELARRATLDQIPAYQRRVLHKQVLNVLSEPPIAPDCLGTLVFHADQAGDTDAVVTYGPVAARRASSLGANREAADLYALTLRHADTVTAEQKATWLEQHAFSSHLSGRSGAALRSFSEAATLRHTLGDRLGEGDNLRWRSYVLVSLGLTSEAIQVAQTSLGLLEDVGPCLQLASSLANIAEIAVRSFDPRCIEYAARATALGTELGDTALVVRVGFFAQLAKVLSSDTGWDELEAIWREAMTAEGGLEHAGITGANLCWFAAVHHQLDRAQTYIKDTSAFCYAHDLGVFHPFATGAAGFVALHRGEWTDALACADEMLTRPGLIALHRTLPLITMALIYARRGEQPVAALLDEALAGAEPDDLYHLGPAWAARAEAAWLAGDDDALRAEANTGLAAATEYTDPWLVGPLRRWAHLAGVPFDDAPTVDTVTPYRFELSGEWQAAAAEWTRLGCPYDAAVAQLGGDISAVETALATFRALGARAAARRAQQRLARLRGRNPDARNRATIADPNGLTPRERDVLELVAAGYSDAQIGETLFISPKTANRHVGSILLKLGVRNRTQAAAFATQKSLVR